MIDVSGAIENLRSSISKAKDAADALTAKMLGEERDAFTKEEQEAFDAHLDSIERAKKSIESLERQAQLVGEERESRTREPGRSSTEPRTREDESGDGDDAEEKRYAEAFRRYVRHGMRELDSEDRTLLRSRYKPETETRNPQASTPGSAGGYLIPKSFVNSLEKAMKDYSGVLQAPHKQFNTTSGEPLHWPNMDDTDNEGEQVGENDEVTDQEMEFGEVEFKWFNYSSKVVRIPLSLLEDSGINIDAEVGQILGTRIGRIVNNRLTNGNGATQPQGIVTASVLGRLAGSQTAISYQDLIALEHSVDPAYRNSPAFGFMFHDTTLAVLRNIVDANGRPLWQPQASSGMAAGVPATLNGRPYWINQHMAVPAASARTILCGDFSKYAVRKIRDLRLIRFDELYMRRFQIGFLVAGRYDGRMIDAGTNPIKHLQQAAA